MVRFGREDVLGHPANVMLSEEGKIINKVFYAKKVGYDKREAIIKCEYLLPVHKTLGVKFKPFVDVGDLSKIGDAISILKDNDFLDVKQSGSAERQRIYFLLPLEEGNIDKSSEGILDNYLYPI